MAERYDRNYTYNKRKRIPDSNVRSDQNKRRNNSKRTNMNDRAELQRAKTTRKRPAPKKQAYSPSARQKEINKKRDRDIIRKNQFIGVDDSYIKKNPDALYHDGFDGFEAEFRPKKTKRTLTPTQRKAKRISLLSFFLLIATVIGVVLSLTVFFKTEKITVTQQDKTGQKYTSEQILTASKLKIGENLFLSNKDAARDRILEACPYLETVTINIKIPDTLEVSVKQTKPIYYAEMDKKYLLLGSNNKILETSDKMIHKIPVLKGVSLTGTDVGQKVSFDEKSVQTILDSIISCAKKNNLNNINEIDLSTLSNIKIRCDDRINIIIGTNSAIDYKLRTAITIMNEKLTKKDKGTLDVSLCNEGKRQSSFLPDDMANSENNIVLPIDTDTSSDTESMTDTDAFSNETQDNEAGYSGDGYYEDGYTGDGYTGDDYSNDNYEG